jgi:uncharacterized protein
MAEVEKIRRENVSIPNGERERTSGVLSLPTGHMRRTGVIVAHGAGNDVHTPLLVTFCEGLAAAGYPALRFNFLYKEHGRQAPDKYETLAQTWASAEAFFLERLGQQIDFWVAAGKSMGGRVASQMVAEGHLTARRLIFLGYPLHAADNKERLRDAHLYPISIPLLFFAGTRDPLCDLEKLRPVLKRISAPWTLRVVEGGDHSFHVPKSLGISESEIVRRIIEETLRWLEGRPPEPLR